MPGTEIVAQKPKRQNLSILQKKGMQLMSCSKAAKMGLIIRGDLEKGRRTFSAAAADDRCLVEAVQEAEG